jgi:predicted TIM-barrel fold metal-dependent hydrolase
MNAKAAIPVRRRIDAHHHLWQLGRFPYAWLAPDSPPRPFGDHAALKRNYLPTDYSADIEGTGIVASVFVEANAGAPGAREIEWVDEIALDGQLPVAAVGSLDLRRPDVASALTAFQRSSRMRGVRMSLCWDDRPRWRFIDRPDVMQMAEFHAGLAELTRRGLVFDVLVVPGQLSQLAALARAHRDQVIVIDHMGTPWFETAGDRDVWRRGMRECSECRNIVVKISGLWTLDRQWRPAIIREPVRFVVDLFGPGRCLWASNLPVEEIMCAAHDQIAHLEDVLADLAEDEKDMIFCGTAARVYRVHVGADADRPPLMNRTTHR